MHLQYEEHITPWVRENLEALEQELGREIHLLDFNTARQAEAARSTDRAFILVGGYYGTLTMDLGRSVFGHAFTYSTPSEPNRLDAPIYADGQCVGEVLPNCVCSWPFLGYYEAHEDHWRVIFEALRLACSPELAERAAEREQQRTTEALREYARGVYNNGIVAAREGVDAAQRTIISHQDRISLLMHTMRDTQQQLDALLLRQQSDSAERVLQEYEHLRNHPRVASVGFDTEAQRLVVTTTDDLRLTRSDTGDSRWLGAFKVQIALDGNGITLTNLNTRRGGRDHPHVTDGRPCFGGHHEAFMQLLAEGDLLTLFELLLQYIETLNLEDEYGRYGSYWFEIPDERPLVAEEVCA